jgi:uncharacterized protein
VSALTLLAGALVVLGLVGIVVPVLPGSLLVAAGVLVWALGTGTPLAWAALAVVVVLLVAGQVLSYGLAGRTLVVAGIPQRSLVLAGLAGLVGFFALPVLGLPLGVVVGLYLAERARLGQGEAAWRSTVVGLRAVGVAIVVELAAGLAAAGCWVAAVVAHA